MHDRLTTPVPLEGLVLDGFPRAVAQARLVDTWEGGGIRLSAVVRLQIADDEVIQRVVERGKIGGRSDDRLSTVRRRLEVYREMTEPLIGLYRGRGILVEVDGLAGSTRSPPGSARRCRQSLIRPAICGAHDPGWHCHPAGSQVQVI